MRPALATGLDLLVRHPRHAVLAGLVGGLAGGPFARGGPPVLACAVAVALLACAPRLLAWARGGPGSIAVPLLGASLAALAGSVAAQERVDAIDATALAPLIGRQVRLDAVLLEPQRMRPWGATVAPARIGAGWPGAGERILLRAAAHGGVAARWPRSPTGAEVRVVGRLRALGRGDAHERRRGAHAELVITSLTPTGARRGGLAGVLDAARRRAEDALSRALPATEAGLARGMVLGQDDALPDELREDFRATGLAHLLAASGTNVALLAALVVAVATVAGVGLTCRLLLAMSAIAVYVPLAGGGPSIQRAGVMGGAGLLALLAGRPRSRWYALGLAAAVTLALNPYAIADVGWQLSFAAVVALLAVGPALAGALRRAMPGSLADALALTLAATAGTAPLVALHFERVSVVSLGANVLAAPVVGPIMWLGAIAAVAGQVLPALAVVPAALAGPALAYLGWLAGVAAGMPGAEATIGLSPAGAVAAYVGLAAALLALRRRRAAAGRPGRRTRVLLGTGAIAACLALAVGLVRARGPAPPAGLVVSFGTRSLARGHRPLARCSTLHPTAPS